MSGAQQGVKQKTIPVFMDTEQSLDYDMLSVFLFYPPSHHCDLPAPSKLMVGIHTCMSIKINECPRMRQKCPWFRVIP